MSASFVEADTAKGSAFDFLAVGEVADLLSVSRYTLRYWRRQNIGPTWYRIGGSVKYKRDDVEHWVASQEQVRG